MTVRGPSARLVAVVATIAGTTIGIATATLEGFLLPLNLRTPVAVGRSAVGYPKATIEETDFDFGRMDGGTSATHEFSITNDGEATLELKQGSTSCTCTISGVDRSTVAPGEKAIVTLQWKVPTRDEGDHGTFRQQAVILTNDPRRPEVTLSIHGVIFSKWQMTPTSIVFSDVQNDAVAESTATLVTFGQGSTRLDAVRVTGEASADAPPGSGDAVEAPPPAPESRFFAAKAVPFTAEELASSSGTSGGFHVTVTTVPPLPIGIVRGNLAITFTTLSTDGQTTTAMPESSDTEGSATEPSSTVVTVPLEAKVMGPLAVAGAAWDSRLQVVNVGTVSSTVGYQTTLFVTARGDHRNDVRPVVVEKIPESLQVTIGESAAVGTGAVVRIPLEIGIPKESPTCNHLGSRQGRLGKIVLETGHPDAPLLTIPVRVAVGP